MEISETYISNLITNLRKLSTVVLLESQMPGHPASTKSYLAANPRAWIKSWGNEIEIMEAGKRRKFQKNPWEALTEFKNKQSDWLFGYLGYELKDHIELLESGNTECLHAPDLFFMIPDFLIEVDARHNLTFLKGKLPEKTIQPKNKSKVEIQLKNQISESNYVKLLEQAKRDIYEGEYYEINLSHPLEFELKGDSWNLYKLMKSAGPVPFGGYLEFDNLAICSSSPERFLAREGSKVWSQPIKGTASRTGEINELEAIEKLKHSEKERAENLMIVDLVRNDLGRVAVKNSVKVSSLFEVQSFETVHQMVSTVECEVEEKAESIDVIKACFPMGSMTGAPKIAAMMAIEQYENYKRGIYSGAMGYIKPNGDFDFNVVIRTAIIEGKKLIYPVGGAITSDSDPVEEWNETLLKARAITNIFGLAKKS